MGTPLWLVTAGLLLLSCGWVNSQKMRHLLGQPVARMRMVERPLKITGGGKIKDLASHSGVEVVTKNGGHYVIHKGADYGGGNVGGNTVVVDAKYMSKKWTPASTWKEPNEKILVTDMVKAGGKDYNAIKDNCHDASKNMMYGNEKSDSKLVFLKPQVPEEDRIP